MSARWREPDSISRARPTPGVLADAGLRPCRILLVREIRRRRHGRVRRDREILWGWRRGNGNFVAASNRWSAAMPQPNDLNRSLVALDQNSTIIAVVELSQSSWLLHAGIWDALEPLGHETDQSGPAGLHEGVVVHIILRDQLGEACSVVAVHDLREEMGEVFRLAHCRAPCEEDRRDGIVSHKSCKTAPYRMQGALEGPHLRRWKDNDPRRLRMAEKRAAILDAAWPIFLRDGWVGASLERVAAESGISKMTVYRHFGTKEELFEEIVEEMCRRMLAGAEAAAPAAGLSLANRLTAEAHSFVAALTGLEALAFYRLVIADGWRFPALARAFERSGMAVLRRRVSAILEEAGLNPAETARRASGFINLALGDAYLEAALGIDDPDRGARFEAQIAAAADFALAGAL